MNRDEIINMPAGREMDALIAEKVMGWHKVKYLGTMDWCDDSGEQPYTVGAWKPSQDIEAAFGMVDEMTYGEDFEFVMGTSRIHGWFAEFKKEGVAISENRVNTKTLCVAICRAALLAVMEAE